MKIVKFVIGLFIPYSIGMAVHRYRYNKNQKTKELKKNKLESSFNKSAHKFNYENSINFLIEKGIEEKQIREGSMPESSLQFCCEVLESKLKFENPVIGLHIGNFLGVSLAYFTDFIIYRNDKSSIFSIDPNIPHRGIVSPQTFVIELLNRYDLQKNVAILTGYSINKNVSNDGSFYDNQYDPFKNYDKEMSCENQLQNLQRLNIQNFDFCIIDGNHDENYLAAELREIYGLIKKDGVLILDDVSVSWAKIKKVFNEIDTELFRKIGENGRVGILQKI